MSSLVWMGYVDDISCRIMEVNKDDCIVETTVWEIADDIWDVSNDDSFCAKVYMTAFLSEHRLIKRLSSI